jgi:Tol biopolymer transport system component
MDGGNSRSLVSGSGEWIQDVGPDGKTVLYARADTPRALFAAPIAGGEPRKIATDFGSVATVSPDGSKVAYLTVPDVEGVSPTTCVVVSIEGGSPIATFTWTTQSFAPKWTPDGKGLSFRMGKDTVDNVFVQPLSGGPPRPLTRFTEGQIRDYLWTQDGKHLVLNREFDRESNLWRAGADGRAPEPITDFPTGSVFAIDASKDGGTVYFLYGNENSDIVLLTDFR